jgi:plastocyanin
MLRPRLLIWLVALSIAAAACGGSASPNTVGGAGATGRPAASGSVVSFKETEYTMAPSELTLKAGTYTFEVQNVGQFPHDLHVATTADGTEVGSSAVIITGQSASFTVRLQSGKYTLWCAVNSHRSLGMEGTLTVQ